MNTLLILAQSTSPAPIITELLDSTTNQPPLMLTVAAVSAFLIAIIQTLRVGSLRKRQNQPSKILDQSPTPTAIMDMKFNIRYGNSALAELLGYSQEKLKNLPYKTHTPLASTNADDEQMANLKETGSLGPYQKEFIKQNGERVPATIHGNNTRYQGSAAIVVSINPVSEDKNNTAQQITTVYDDQFDKIAAGVAHDLSNAVGPIMAYPEIILESIPLEDFQIINDINEIRNASYRLTRIIRSMDNLTISENLPADYISLNRVIDGYVNSADYDSCKKRFPGTKLIVEKDVSHRSVHSSFSHLVLVLSYLVDHCYDSLDRRVGGEVLIRTSSYSEDISHKASLADTAVLSVKDNGNGVDIAEDENPFSPFYMRQKGGIRGNGLGLPAAQSLIKGCGGSIEIQSAPGKGTEFIVRFPMTDHIDMDSEETTRFNGTEKVLVVDDILEQRRLAAKIISSLGYHVETLASGAEAVEFFKNNDADLLLIDMYLAPGYSGIDTIRDIKKSKPDIKSIIVSAYAETSIVEHSGEVGVEDYVRKPYNVAKIGSAIRKALDQK